MAVSAATEEEKTKKRRRTRSLKSCLAVEENRSIQVLRWVRAGPAGL